MQELLIEISNVCFMILPSLVRFRYSLVSILGTGMRQNMAKGPGNASIIASRITGSLLHSLVPKRDGNHEVSHV